MKTLRDIEADRILEMYGHLPDAVPQIMGMLERQFTMLHNRAQVLLTLCGVVVTVTGFSGRLIAGTNPLAQALIILGLLFTLGAAAVVVWGVLHLWWLSQHPGELPRGWLLHCLKYRDRKTAAYRVGLILLGAGLSVYVAAVSIMLLNPHAHELPMAR